MITKKQIKNECLPILAQNPHLADVITVMADLPEGITWRKMTDNQALLVWLNVRMFMTPWVGGLLREMVDKHNGTLCTCQ